MGARGLLVVEDADGVRTCGEVVGIVGGDRVGILVGRIR